MSYSDAIARADLRRAPLGRGASRTGRILDFLTRKRALATTLAVLAWIACNLLAGRRPRDLTALEDPTIIVAMVCVVLGLSLRAWAAGTLQKSTVLTTAGPYQVIRNPLYAGSFFLTIGFCLLMGPPVDLLILLLPIVGLYVLKVRKEEKSLAGSHPAAWAEYAHRTPRFFPRRWPAIDFSAWRWTLWVRNHEYRAFAAVIAGLAILQIWRQL